MPRIEYGGGSAPVTFERGGGSGTAAIPPITPAKPEVSRKRKLSEADRILLEEETPLMRRRKKDAKKREVAQSQWVRRHGWYMTEEELDEWFKYGDLSNEIEVPEGYEL